MDLSTLAEEAILHTCPLYEMRRMRAATSPRRNAAGEAAPAPLRWCNQFVHALQDGFAVRTLACWTSSPTPSPTWASA
jgi:hypothetical protein